MRIPHIRVLIRCALASTLTACASLFFLFVIAPQEADARKKEAARLVIEARAALVAGEACPRHDHFEIECRGRDVRVLSRGTPWLFGFDRVDVGDGPRVRMAGADGQLGTRDDVVVGPERVTKYLSMDELLALTSQN